jgi:hypothetical protein
VRAANWVDDGGGDTAALRRIRGGGQLEDDPLRRRGCRGVRESEGAARGAWGAENGEARHGDTAVVVGGEVDDVFAKRPLDFRFLFTTRSFLLLFLILLNPVAFPGFYLGT